MLRVGERPPFLFHTQLFDMVVVDGRLLTSVRYSFFIFHVFYFRISSPFSLFVLLGCRCNGVYILRSCGILLAYSV